MDDIRWFAPNAYTGLLAPALRRLGLSVATDGDAPARLAFAMSGLRAEAAWRFARTHGSRLLLYLWDLPPARTGRGRADPVWWVAGRFVRVPRLVGGYGGRRGYYSRLSYIARRADAVWVPSGMTRDTVLERFGVPALRVPYCYDSGRFAPAPAGTPKDAPPTLLTVSRLVPYKNQAAVLRAAAALGRPVQVRLIGRGPEQRRLEALAARLGVSCRVETDVDDPAVVRAYHRAAVAVCPSAFEGFGLTPIEAVASGVPVVASDIPPHREHLTGGSRLVPPGDVPALAAAIGEALEDTPADPSLVRHLTIEAAAERFVSCLRGLLG